MKTLKRIIALSSAIVMAVSASVGAMTFYDPISQYFELSSAVYEPSGNLPYSQKSFVMVPKATAKRTGYVLGEDNVKDYTAQTTDEGYVYDGFDGASTYIHIPGTLGVGETNIQNRHCLTLGHPNYGGYETSNNSSAFAPSFGKCKSEVIFRFGNVKGIENTSFQFAPFDLVNYVLLNDGTIKPFKAEHYYTYSGNRVGVQFTSNSFPLNENYANGFSCDVWNKISLSYDIQNDLVEYRLSSFDAEGNETVKRVLTTTLSSVYGSKPIAVLNAMRFRPGTIQDTDIASMTLTRDTFFFENQSVNADENTVSASVKVSNNQLIKNRFYGVFNDWWATTDNVGVYKNTPELMLAQYDQNGALLGVKTTNAVLEPSLKHVSGEVNISLVPASLQYPANTTLSITDDKLPNYSYAKAYVWGGDEKIVATPNSHTDKTDTIVNKGLVPYTKASDTRPAPAE